MRGGFNCDSSQPPETLVFGPPHAMFGYVGERIEHEIVVVGRQLAFVNHKLQGQLETMKDLLHE